jgi:uncharacterized protein (DUF983 family)
VSGPLAPPQEESAAERILRLTGVDVKRCPHCGQGQLVYSCKLPPVRAGP